MEILGGTNAEEHERFQSAVAALDSGDLARLERLVDAHPALLRYECRVGEWYENGYFAGATLLMHVAGNPIRAPLPANIVELARAMIARHVTREDAQRTLALVLTSKQASDTGVALPLIDLLADAGACFDLEATDVLSAPLLNDAPGTAKALVERGARMQLRHAAALGEVGVMTRMLADVVEQNALDDALLYACIRGQRKAATLLVERGARGDVLLAPGGATPRTALHEAATRGYAEIVELLLGAGASAGIPDAHFNGTAAGWADAGGFHALAHKLRDATP